jgi:hypothetical protein
MANPPRDECVILSREQVRCKGKSAVIGFLKSDGKAELRLPFHEIYPEIDRLNERYERDFKLISPHFADPMMKEGWSRLSDLLPLATDSVVGYERTNQPLGSEIAFSGHGTPRLVLPTGIYKGENGIALAVIGLSTKDFRKDGSDVFFDISEERIIPVPDFPAESGEYLKHPQTTIPHGKQVDRNESLCLRRGEGPYVGSIAYGGYRSDIRLDLRPWDPLVVAVSGAEERAFLTAIGITPEEMPGLLSGAKNELQGLSAILKPSLISSLDRVIASLEHKDR